MSLTNFPHGVTSFGIPLIAGDTTITTGTAFFVDSTTGSDSYDGKTPATPFATIDAAINACTANKGDKIYVLPGHAESNANATTINLDVAGITIQGLGSGSLRPTITFTTATTATIPVSAANITIRNIVFNANFADIVAVFTIAAAKNFHVEQCAIKANAANVNFLYVFDTNTTDNAADGLHFVDSTWIEPDSATVSLCKVDATQDSWVVDRNYISIATQATGGGMFVIATGKILTNLRCSYNRARLIGGDLSGAGVVFTTDGSTNTGVFSFNVVQHTDSGSEIFGTASSGFSFFDNKLSGVAGASGYLLPTVDS